MENFYPLNLALTVSNSTCKGCGRVRRCDKESGDTLKSMESIYIHQYQYNLDELMLIPIAKALKGENCHLAFLTGVYGTYLDIIYSQ